MIQCNDEAIQGADKIKYRLLDLMMDSISKMVDICFERKEWIYSVKYNPSDAINISDFFYKLGEAESLLKVAEIIFNNAHNDEEVNGGIQMLRGVIHDARTIQGHIIDDFKTYSRKGKRGREKANTNLSLLDVLNGDKSLYKKIVSLNDEKRLKGVRVGHLFVALVREEILPFDYCRNTFYNAIEKEFGNIGDFRNINAFIRDSLNDKTLKEADIAKIINIKKKLF